MTQAFDQIATGLREAIAFAKGDSQGVVVHQIIVEDSDVRAIRTATGLNQQEFATSIGVAVGTLRGWEQNRRRPEGPARVLLALIGKNPLLVQEYLVAKG
jgi:putative transcriptional regulator